MILKYKNRAGYFLAGAVAAWAVRHYGHVENNQAIAVALELAFAIFWILACWQIALSKGYNTWVGIIFAFIPAGILILYFLLPDKTKQKQVIEQRFDGYRDKPNSENQNRPLEILNRL